MGTHREVAIVDGGGANIASLKFALERLGAAGVLTTDAERIRSATHVILPGVGAARAAMDRLQVTGLDLLIRQLTQPVLGICLGLQLLFDASEEDQATCLGIIRGRVRRFKACAERPVPHMGWNQVRKLRECALLADIPEDGYFYFVHSFAAEAGPSTVAVADYGWPFAAVVEERNFVATQFHPERSGDLGSRVLRNFLERY
jgi:imidazole glycerol-phosphate synthase subunit HisH